MEKLVVAYVCDKTYLPFLKKSIESVKRYNKNVEFCCISKDHFVLDDVQVYTINPDSSKFKFNHNDRMKEAVYYKFYLPILPYSKILYLDCDTMCQRPLNDLWNTKCDFICATKSYNIGELQAKQLGLENYYLTGMMLMNLDALRIFNFTDKCLERVSKEATVKQHDETIINLEFGKYITEVDRKYNYCKNRIYDNPIAESDAYILHYVGKNDKNYMLGNTNFESLDPLKKLLKEKNIAIVGNSETIFNKQNGSDIDNHDIIIRFNRGFIKDKECQGSKTDLLFLAASLTNEEIKQFSPKYTIKRSRYCTSKCDFELRVSDRAQFAQVPNKETARQKLAKSQASTGFLAIQFVLSTNYKNLDIYGFDFLKSRTFYNKPDYKPLHNGDKEAEKVLEYEKSGLLKLH